jgi:DNA mismatch repair protein MutS
VLDRLEADSISHAGLADLPLFAVAEPAAPIPSAPGPVETALAALDLDGMSPREAMDALYRLKGMVP